MTDTSRETMRLFYGTEPETPNNWQQLQQIVDLEAPGVFDGILAEVAAISNDVELQFFMAGDSVFRALSQEIDALLPLLKEQLAAEELRLRFGLPQSLLAVPVFMSLAQAEVNSKISLRNEAAVVGESIKDRIMRLVLGVQLFLSEQLEAVERELAAHAEAFETSATVAAATSELTPVLSNFMPAFDTKRIELNHRKSLIEKLIRQTEQLLGQRLERGLSETVFEAATQSTQPTLIRAAA